MSKFSSDVGVFLLKGVGFPNVIDAPMATRSGIFIAAISDMQTYCLRSKMDELGLCEWFSLAW